MRLGIDRLLEESSLHRDLAGRRLALLANPASLTSALTHTADEISKISKLQLSALFGPQHGVRGDKQDNMIETADSFDEALGVPVYSLYGEVRRPTPEMMESFDVLLVDLQDVGCRVYTYLTTLFYVLEACAKHNKSVWVLDRPNPVGRPAEGLCLMEGHESFVGGARLPMRHGLTLAEAARWYIAQQELEVDFRAIGMEGYDPTFEGHWGWPNRLTWINPSPNLPTLNSARVYPGTVILEGTTLSEGRGTTRALEVFGAPNIDVPDLLKKLQASSWSRGCFLRPCFFEPTFHKHQGELCAGIQVHTDFSGYEHNRFKPYRIIALALKSILEQSSDYQLWRRHDYEYEIGRLPIDVITGGTFFREWVEDRAATQDDLERRLHVDETSWVQQRRPYLLYAE